VLVLISTARTPVRGSSEKENEMELFEAIESRKSVRAFKPEAVPTETMKEVLKSATRAPSSVNSQPWEFFIVKGEELHQLKSR